MNSIYPYLTTLLAKQLSHGSRSPWMVALVVTWAIGATTSGSLLAQESNVSAFDWQLTSGDHFVVTLEQNSDSQTAVDSREVVVNSRLVVVMDWKVKGVDESGTATVEQSIRSIELSVRNPEISDQAIEYDTTDPDSAKRESKKLLRQVQPLIGLPFDVQLEKSGKIAAVTLPESTRKVIDELAGAVRIRALFSKGGLEEMLGAVAVVPPGTQAGESWSQQQAVNNPAGQFTRTRKFTFVGPAKKDDRAMAEFRLDVTLEPTKAIAGEGAGQSMATKLIAFTGSGEFWYDNEAGFFRSSTTRNTAETEKLYREKKIVTSVTNETKTTVVKQ